MDSIVQSHSQPPRWHRRGREAALGLTTHKTDSRAARAVVHRPLELCAALSALRSPRSHEPQQNAVLLPFASEFPMKDKRRDRRSRSGPQRKARGDARSVKHQEPTDKGEMAGRAEESIESEWPFAIRCNTLTK